MAATADQMVRFSEGRLGTGPVAASVALYADTMCFFTVTGYLTNVIGTNNVNRFAGLVKDQKDNSSGAAGALEAEFKEEGEFELTGSGFSQASVGLEAYASDNFTVTVDASAGVHIGTIVRYISSTKVLVRIGKSMSGGGIKRKISFTFDPASVAAATVAEQTVTVAGLLTTDTVLVTPPALATAIGVAGARVSAANTLAIRLVNPTAGALDEASGTWIATVFR